MNAQAMERSAAAIIAKLPMEEQYQVTQLRLQRGETQGEFVRHAIWKAAQAYELTADDYERLAGMVAKPEVKMTPQPDGRVYLEVAGQLADDIRAVGRKRGVPAAVVLREAIAEFEASITKGT